MELSVPFNCTFLFKEMKCNSSQPWASSFGMDPQPDFQSTAEPHFSTAVSDRILFYVYRLLPKNLIYEKPYFALKFKKISSFSQNRHSFKLPECFSRNYYRAAFQLVFPQSRR